MYNRLISCLEICLKKGKFVSGLFLDFSKAYATINHDILFNKLYGIKGKGLSFVLGYLTNRYQYNEYDNENSSKSKIFFRGGCPSRCNIWTLVRLDLHK